MDFTVEAEASAAVSRRFVTTRRYLKSHKLYETVSVPVTSRTLSLAADTGVTNFVGVVSDRSSFGGKQMLALYNF